MQLKDSLAWVLSMTIKNCDARSRIGTIYRKTNDERGKDLFSSIFLFVLFLFFIFTTACTIIWCTDALILASIPSVVKLWTRANSFVLTIAPVRFLSDDSQAHKIPTKYRRTQQFDKTDSLTPRNSWICLVILITLIKYSPLCQDDAARGTSFCRAPGLATAARGSGGGYWQVINTYIYFYQPFYRWQRTKRTRRRKATKQYRTKCGRRAEKRAYQYTCFSSSSSDGMNWLFKRFTPTQNPLNASIIRNAVSSAPSVGKELGSCRSFLCDSDVLI